MPRSPSRWAERTRAGSVARRIVPAAVGAALALAAASCSGRRVATSEGDVGAARGGAARGGAVRGAPTPTRPAQGTARVVRVLLSSTARTSVELSSDGDWRLYEGGGRSLLARGIAGRRWRIERVGARRLRAVRDDGEATPARDGPFLARTLDDRAAVLTWNGRRWRGDLLVVATDSGLLVVNQLGVEEYLRGVVPLEIGARPDAERAAAEAQAVAARSYVYVRATGDPRRQWDVVGTVIDQVYGGADAEKVVTDLAISATAGEVLTVRGRVVSAPFHAVCGGTTATPDEVWRGTSPEAHLRSVRDVDPRTGRAWCEPAPRYRWSRSFTAVALEASLARWVRSQGGAGAPGRVRTARVERTTASGRVGTLALETDGGRLELRGNDIRFALRAPGGEILSSTYFSVEPALGRDGRLAELTLRGTGYGHGVGMCQWGAIGRARAGQDYRRILQAYFPGASIERVE